MTDTDKIVSLKAKNGAVIKCGQMTPTWSVRYSYEPEPEKRQHYKEYEFQKDKERLSSKHGFLFQNLRPCDAQSHKHKMGFSGDKF